MIRLKPAVVAQIQEHKILKGLITGTLGITPATMNKYLTENHIILTSIDCINLIAQYLNLNLYDMLAGGRLFEPLPV